MSFYISGIILIISLLFIFEEALKNIRGDYNHKTFFYSAILILFSYLLYIWAFISDNFSLIEVYGHSTKGLPLWLKVSASWAGIGGSFFLWTVFMVFIAIIYRYHLKRIGRIEHKVLASYNVIIVALIILTIISGTFDTIDFSPPAGAGLNPLLRSFWIIIHPIFTFAGYGFGVALALHALLSESRDDFWERSMASFGWITLSIGIIAGAIWAYVVLGWGGY